MFLLCKKKTNTISNEKVLYLDTYNMIPLISNTKCTQNRIIIKRACLMYAVYVNVWPIFILILYNVNDCTYNHNEDKMTSLDNLFLAYETRMKYVKIYI